MPETYSTMLLTFSAQISFFSLPYLRTMRKDSHSAGMSSRSAIDREGTLTGPENPALIESLKEQGFIAAE